MILSSISPHIILFHHQHILVIFEFNVAKIITEKVLGAFLSVINIGEIMKIKSFFSKRNSVHCLFAVRVKFCQNPSIFSQNGIDSAYGRVCVFVYFVVERVATIIRTEFLILSTRKFYATFVTGSFLYSHHYYFKIELSGYHKINKN